MKKLLIVDGSNLLFQMFYGMPARILGPAGQPIQGTLGFVGALLKIIRMVQPTHAIVIFDGECANPRRELDEDYKANRPDYSQVAEEDLPFSQLPDIFRALALLQIPYAETTDCEADDWMAAYARQYGEVMDVVISSQDSDLFQLISPRVQILRYRGEKTLLCDVAYIREKLGIEPEQYADFKSLTGDHSDNIRGVDKVGPKTAAELLGQFGTLDQILARTEEITKPSVRASLQRQGERARLNRLLIRLDGSASVPFAPEACPCRVTDQTTTQVMQALGLR